MEIKKNKLARYRYIAMPVDHTIFTTLLPSTSPARLLACSLPCASLRARSSSHHPNKKSRAMSLNQGVKEFAVAGSAGQSERTRGHKDARYSQDSSNIAWSSALSTYLWSRISFGFGVTVTSAVKNRM